MYPQSDRAPLDRAPLDNVCYLACTCTNSFFFSSCEHKIEFREMQTLDVVCSYELGVSNWPTRLCSSARKTLIYKNQFKLGSSFAWLNCVAETPRPWPSTETTRLRMANFKEEKLWDWCIIQNDDEKFLAIVTFSGRLASFDLVSGKCQWEASEMIPDCEKTMRALGITTDGNGHMFVRDSRNRCIHLFSFNGKFVQTLLKTTDIGVGSIKRVRWDANTSSLVVAYQEKEQHYVTIVKIQV